MAVHYPLNGIDLDFSRYECRYLHARDILVNRIMQDYMRPQPRTSDIYSRHYVLNQHPKCFFDAFKRRDRELGLDIRVLEKLLQTNYFTIPSIKQLMVVPFRWRMNYSAPYLEKSKSLGDLVLGLVEQHYLESSPSIRTWLKYIHSFYSEGLTQKHASGWKKDMIEHLKRTQPFSTTHHQYSVFSGGHYLPTCGPSNMFSFIEPDFYITPWADYFMSGLDLRILALPDRALDNIYVAETVNIYRGRQNRTSSQPPPGTWSAVFIDGLDRLDVPGILKLLDKSIIFFPRRPLSELDKLSRRRSLSRTHIREMFTDKPEYVHSRDSRVRLSPLESTPPCANCAQPGHLGKKCPSTCGYCNSMSHKATTCPIKVTNRCKCRPFPQFHLAARCFVRCSRRCGNPYHPGHCKHQNAMTCTHRCCMCGTKGHSGKTCSLKKCRCGAQHLTQDCRWKVECPAKDCNFYLCDIHCRECGKKKDKESKEHFAGRTCQDCLKNGKPVLAKASEMGGS